MALREKVLRKKVEKLELKGLQNNKVFPESLSGLEELLQDVFVTRRPKPSDYHNRRDLVRVLNEIAKEIYGNCDNCPTVVEFGSFSMDLFSPESDLDLSVNFSKNATEFPREQKIKTLRKFAKKFYALQSKGHVSGVQPIMTARVPILKVVDSGSGTECDISVENRDGILKSQIVHMISSVDERFQKLCFLMKAWAKTHNINSSRDRTLNSLSIILLVAFHLQTRDPPILPPFSAILKDGKDPASVMKLVSSFLNYGKGNKESLAKLFVTLLIKLSSVEKLWSKGLCASTYEGSWISKTWDSEVGCISVEDFTDRSQNVSRAVGTYQVQKIYKCIQLSIQHIYAFMDGVIPKQKLRGYLFDRDAKPTPVNTGTINLVKRPELPCNPLGPSQAPTMLPRGWGGMQPSISVNPTSTKRRLPAVGWEGIPTGLLGGPPVEGSGGKNQVPSVCWGGTNWGKRPTQGWGEGTNPIMPKRMRATEFWGGYPTENLTPSIGSWGGTSTANWAVTHPIALNATQTRYMPSTASWGGKHQPFSVNPIWSKEMRPIEGWGGSQQASSTSSNQVYCASRKLHSVLPENPGSRETLSGTVRQINLVSQHSNLTFDRSRSNQNSRHGVDFNAYGTL